MAYTPGRHEWRTEYAHRWHYADEPGAGCSIPCKPDGSIPIKKLEAFGDLMARVVAGELIYDGVVATEQHFYIPPELDCTCGEHIVLHSASTNRCPRCGRYYNGAGQDIVLPHNQEFYW